MEISTQYTSGIRVLHIAVAAITDKFYDTFFLKQLEEGIDISAVFIPYSSSLYKEENLERFKYYDSKVPVVLSPIKTNLDRIMYFSKIRKYAQYCESSIKLISCNLIHAHHLYSDGGVAYLLHKKYKIPYIVSVRTTDTEYFLKYFVHTKKFIYRVLESAEQVVCINPMIKEKLLERIKENSVREMVEKKLVVIPNGMDDFWIENIHYKQVNHLPKLKLIQVGTLTARKNHKCTIAAVKKLFDRGYEVELDIVGDGEERNALKKLCEINNLQDRVRFHGFIKDKQKLLDFYREADFFILPSFTETFGIAYIEAMSQGLPVVYTRYQGIDGYYQELEVGAHIDANSPDSVAEAIIELSKNYMETSFRCSNKASDFKWKDIVLEYKEMYSRAIIRNTTTNVDRGYKNENC